MYELIASTIYLSSSHEGSNKTGRRANKDAYLLCTRSNGPYNSARSERRVGFEEGGLIGRRGIKTSREIDSSNGIRAISFLILVVEWLIASYPPWNRYVQSAIFISNGTLHSTSYCLISRIFYSVFASSWTNRIIKNQVGTILSNLSIWCIIN